MTTKKKLFVILIILLATVIGIYIGGNLWFSLGMMPPKNQISQEEKQFESDFERTHPFFSCRVFYHVSTTYYYKKNILIEYKLRTNEYFDQIDKNALADSVFRSFSKVKQKYYSDSLYISFRCRRNKIGAEMDEYIDFGYKCK